MPQHYTPQALAALDDEIEVAQGRHNAALLSMGDDTTHESWHDNPAFEHAKQEVDMTRETLNRLKNLRKEATVIERETTHIVEVGSTIRVHIDGDEEATSFHIAGHFVAGRSHDEDVFMLATTSPLGEALIGHVEGDLISYMTPSGRVIQATIVEVVS